MGKIVPTYVIDRNDRLAVVLCHEQECGLHFAIDARVVPMARSGLVVIAVLPQNVLLFIKAAALDYWKRRCVSVRNLSPPLTPVRSGDFFGDGGQGQIACPAILEPVFRYRDGVRTAAPFPNETRTRLQAEARRGAIPTRCPQGLRHRLQLSPSCLAEPPVLDFLKSVTEGKNKQVATDPRRFTVVEPPPFAPQVLEAERPNAIDLALDRSRVYPGHG